MVPSHFMQIEKIPLNLNHKVDRKALPTPEMDVRSREEDYTPPENPTEELLCNLIAEQMKIHKIGTTSDIFEYPIDSLGIIEIQTKLMRYNLKINTQDFYKYRTIQNIVKNINISETVTQTTSDENNLLYSVNNSFYKHTENIKQIVEKHYNTILLVGSTGFLGIHLLKTLLENTSSKIICLVREKNDVSYKDRFLSLLDYYFKDYAIDLNRIEIINSDVTKEKFNLADDSYQNLCENVDLVINTAANVKYYGDYSDFKKINVELTSKLIDFCILNDTEYAHISTLGISGNFLVENTTKNTIFTENDFYIGQNYKQNVYVETKFEAEKMIYEMSKSGLKATILRVGNLTGRISDGHFQVNIQDNAFYNMLSLIINYKILPKSILNNSLEFTPVDCCSYAIYKLLFNYETSNMVFHIFNNNLLSMATIIEYLKEANYEVSILENSEFYNIIEQQSTLNSGENTLKTFINNFDKKDGLLFNSIVEQKNDFTNSYLGDAGFSWEQVDYNYFIKIIKVIGGLN